MRFVTPLLLIFLLSGCYQLAGLQAEMDPLPRLQYGGALAGAERGDLNAQVEIGKIEYDACHHPADAIAWRPKCDWENSSKWNLIAAERGSDEAQFVLGNWYENYQNPKHDDSEAVRWYRLSAEQGKPEAQQFLASHYEHGTGVKQDWAQAYFWFKLSGRASADYLSDIEKHMTGDQITAVKNRITEWKPTRASVAETKH